MTEHPDNDLELASAALDQRLSTEERDLVDAHPTLHQLIDELGRVRAMLADVPDSMLDADAVARRDLAIEEALRVFDREVATSDTTVVPIGHRLRSMIAERWQHPPLRIGSIAAGLLLIGIVAAVTLGRSGDRGDIAGDSLAEQRTGVSEAAVAAVAPAMAADPTIDSITGPASVPIHVSDIAGLIEVTEAIVGTDWSQVPDDRIDFAGELDLFGCSAILTADQSIIATVTWIDQPGLAVIDRATRSVSVLGMGCAVLATTPITEPPLPPATGP